MNREQHLLTILLEECAEVTQQCSKALRFGLDKVRPGEEETNAESIARELEDLQGIMFLLLDGRHIPDLQFDNIVAKQEKVEKFLKVSESLGTLH